jgi:hypothetical protein
MTRAANSEDRRLRAETFTDTGQSIPAATHPSRSRSARARTQSVSGSIRPDRSTAGRNAPGASRPRSGCCQRSSASIPQTRPLSIAILGW